MIPEHIGVYLSGSGEVAGGKLQTHEVAQLSIRDGLIVACDPLVDPEAEPFDRKVPLGKFPVRVVVAEFEGGDQRVAAARIDFKQEPVARWVPALVAGQELSQLAPGEMYGYGVGAGTGCFMDVSAASALAEREMELSESAEFVSYYDDVLDEVMNEHHRDTWTWVDHSPSGDERNVVIFSSGWGDGFYSSYWGEDSNGELVCLVTDFDVLDFDGRDQ